MNQQSLTSPTPRKSIGLSILLPLLFGPLGIFYSSIVAGLILLFPPGFFIVGFTYRDFWGDPYMQSFWIVFIVIYWPICTLISAIVAAVRNSRNYKKQLLNAINQNTATIQSTNTHESNQMQQWLNDNPGSSVNDYYRESK